MKQFNNLREEALLEKLKASDPTGKWISDFVHSDNPKFAGKSKKERIRMALGASYAAKRNEEVEQIDELTDAEVDKMYNAMMKANGNRLLKKHSSEVKKSKDIESGKELEKHIKKNPDVLKTYSNAVKKDKKMYGEEVEQTDEGVMDTVKSGVKKVVKAVTGGSDQDQIKDLQRKMGLPQTGKKPQVKEESDICPVCETDPCVCETGQHIEEESLDEAKPGLYANIHAKRKRIAAGSGERMRKPGSKGAPTAQAFKDAAKTAKNEDVEHTDEMVAPAAAVHTPLSFNSMRMKTDKKYAEKIKASQGKAPTGNVKEENVDESLADMVMGAAKSAGLNAKVNTTSSADRQKATDKLLKNRAKNAPKKTTFSGYRDNSMSSPEAYYKSKKPGQYTGD